MKCPSMVSRSPRSQEHEGRDGDASSLPVDKVIVDPLKGLKGNDDDNSATEELWDRKLEMMVSCSNSYNIFDSANLENHGKICRERTNKGRDQ